MHVKPAGHALTAPKRHLKKKREREREREHSKLNTERKKRKEQKNISGDI